jgi:hypothetical protein
MRSELFAETHNEVQTQERFVKQNSKLLKVSLARRAVGQGRNGGLPRSGPVQP